LTPRDVTIRVDLRDAGEPWRDPLARLVAGNVRRRDQGAIAARLDFRGQQRARPDEAHVPDQDAPELRKLVERRDAEPPAERRDARVIRDRLTRAGNRIRLRSHRAELPAGEEPAITAHAQLLVEDWAAILKLDCRSDSERDRQ